MDIPKHCVEITPNAAHLLIGNDEKTWNNYNQDETIEMTTYHCNGTFVFAVCNFVSGIVQYYVQDINA